LRLPTPLLEAPIIAPESVIDHQYNSDSGTHAIITNILAQDFHLRDASSYRLDPASHCALTAAQVRTTVWPGLKTTAEQQAEILASKALKRAADTSRWAGIPTLPRVFVEVLLDKKIRRGPLPSLAAREERINTIKASLSATGAMRMALLIFPNRDRNPAKNDGQLPDLGETCALLRLWTICRAMELAQRAFFRERFEFLANAMQTDIFTAEQAHDVFAAILIPRKAENMGVTSACETQRRWFQPRTKAFQQLANEFDHFIIQDQRSATRLLLCLAQANKSLAWLLEGMMPHRDLPIKLFAVHDARRYTCYHTDPEDDIVDYTHALKEIAEQLGITNLITLISIEELQDQCPAASLKTFLTNRAVIYEEKMEVYQQCYEHEREALLAITGRDRFLKAIGSLSQEKRVVLLIEAILHGRYHPRFIAYSEQYAIVPQEFQLKFIASIYNKQSDPILEVLRKEVLWSAVWGALQYIASYESNTKTKNNLELDDINLLIPSAVRLSIHTKPETAGHFTIKVGPNVHRTPWHGTAAMKLGSRCPTLEIKLSLELKDNGYVPLFISPEIHPDPHVSHLGRMAKCNQPLLWLHSSLDCPGENNQNLADKLASLKWI
jgi:pyoverdine/dityrosine biosynthesis protein Dit1